MAIATGYKESSFPACSIPPEQRTSTGPTTPVSWFIKKKTPEQNEKDRVGKYAPDFKGNEILSIPESVAKAEPKTV